MTALQFKPDVALQNDPDRFLSPEEAAYLLDSTVKTLANWRCKGKGPRYVRHGARVVYLKRDIDAYRAEVIAAN